MPLRSGFALALVVVLTGISGCSAPDESEPMSNSSVAQVSRAQWDALRQRRVFFGHQSVGDNIIDGLRQIAAAEGWPALNVAVVPTQGAPDGAALYHAAIGKNGDPISKINAFREALENGVGSRVDVAMMKFCFWDIRRDTDVDAVFTAYKRTLDDLSRRFPQVTFVHATVPLVVADQDFGAVARRLIGKKTPTDADNLAREALSAKLRAEYGGRGLVFDIARDQAGAANGAVPSLAKELSSDGAHLNDAGRRRLASQLVRTVAQ